MSDPTQGPTTISQIGVAMFAVADQDAALAFYTEKLGFEARADERYGENGEQRWLEVAPPGSSARLALNPPMGGQPGGGSIGVETADVWASTPGCRRSPESTSTLSRCACPASRRCSACGTRTGTASGSSRRRRPGRPSPSADGERALHAGLAVALHGAVVGVLAGVNEASNSDTPPP